MKKQKGGGGRKPRTQQRTIRPRCGMWSNWDAAIHRDCLIADLFIMAVFEGLGCGHEWCGRLPGSGRYSKCSFFVLEKSRGNRRSPSALKARAAAASGPILTFCPRLGRHVCKCQNQRTTSKIKLLVELLDVRMEGSRQLGRKRQIRSTSNSGDDVRGNLVFDKGDTIAQQKLALLQALQPQ